MEDRRGPPLVDVIVAPNAGLLTGSGTNTYVVGREPSVVIDPAIADDEFLARVSDRAGDVTAILVTHRHSDHVGGIAALAGRTGAPVRAWGRDTADGIDVQPLNDGEVVRAGGVALSALYTPGHASDHVCFLSDSAELFSGDVVLGEGTTVIAPPDGNMRDYMATLHELRACKIERIYPGHGPALDDPARVLDGYIGHRLARERAIVAAIGVGATLDEIVERAYADTPRELHPMAAFSARAHLEWLVEKGEIRSADDKWWTANVN